LKGYTLRKPARRQARPTLDRVDQTGAESDGQTRKLCQNEPKFRLQLDSLQGLASDGFVPPPAIEPNHDMWHPEKSAELVLYLVRP